MRACRRNPTCSRMRYAQTGLTMNLRVLTEGRLHETLHILKAVVLRNQTTITGKSVGKDAGNSTLEDANMHSHDSSLKADFDAAPSKSDRGCR